MKIGFVGLGKLGLPVALTVESKGHEVVGYDISENVKNIIEAKNTLQRKIQKYLKIKKIKCYFIIRKCRKTFRNYI